MPKWFRSLVVLLTESLSPRRSPPLRQRAAPRETTARRYPAIPLLKFNGNGRPPKMQWKASHPATIARFKAEVTCSRGHGIALRDHGVEEDGRVVPSIVCKSKGCDFHEIVRLEGWTAGRLPAMVERKVR